MMPVNKIVVVSMLLIGVIISFVFILLSQNKKNDVKITSSNTSSTITAINIISPTTVQSTKVVMRGSSMNPNYLDNTYYSVDRNYFHSHLPQRGDVVLLVTQSVNGPIEVIKRVIGLPGEKIQIKDGEVLIKGDILSESYLLKPKSTLLYSEAIMKEGQILDIPQDQYFVMGDNREHSSDSRDWSFLEKENIIGKVD